MRILVYLWYLSVQMQFRLHLHMHGRPLLKNFDLSSAPGRVRTDTGVLLGDRPLRWATGAPNNNLVWLSSQQNRSARETWRLIHRRHRRVCRSPGYGARGGRLAGPDVLACAPVRAGPPWVPQTGWVCRPKFPDLTVKKASSTAFGIASSVLFAKILRPYRVQSLQGHELSSARYPMRVS